MLNILLVVLGVLAVAVLITSPKEGAGLYASTGFGCVVAFLLVNYAF